MPQFEHPDYEDLPAGVKAQVSEKEYCWLPDELKRTLVEEMTTPDYEED